MANNGTHALQGVPEPMSEAFLDGTDGGGGGGKRLSSQLLHKNKSPWQFFTFLLLAFFGHGPDGSPSQRGIISTANRVTPTGRLSNVVCYRQS